MRILYSHYLAAAVHPAVRMVEAIAEELVKLGHEVAVHRSAGEGSESAPVPTDPGTGRVLRSKVWFLRALARNRAMIRRDLEAVRSFRPDLILARQDAYSASMAWAARRLNVPLVTYADAPVAYESRLFGSDNGRWHPPGLVERIERQTLLASRAVITVSHPAATILSRYRTETPIHVIPNGVTPGQFPELTEARRRALRNALGLRAPRVAGFAGSFKAFHGMKLLGDLIESTAPRGDTQWLLIGDGPELPELRERLATVGSVVFLGRQPSEEVGRLLATVDVAVAPHPRLEGEFYFCPLKVLEYAAAGCAVVASDQGDLPHLLDDGRLGVLIQSTKTQEWAVALNQLLSDPQRIHQLGREARSWVLDNFTWKRTAQRVEEVLEEVLHSFQTDFSDCGTRLPQGELEMAGASPLAPTRIWGIGPGCLTGSQATPFKSSDHSQMGPPLCSR